MCGGTPRAAEAVRHLEDFHVGDVYELGHWEVARSEIVEFAQRYDPQPRHTCLPDGELVASGWHVAGVFMRLYVDAVVRHAAAEVSPGIDQLRWLRPVHPGDVLTGRVTVTGILPSLSRPDCGIVRQRGELADPQGRPVLRLTFYGLVRKAD
jgi:acyl dehydratase